MRRFIAPISVAAAITGGAAAGALLGVPGISGAQTSTTAPAEDTAPADDPANGGPAVERHARHRDVLGEALRALVQNGTLTEAQAQAVRDAVRERMPEHRHHRKGLLREGLETAAGALNLTRDELVERLREGNTLAQVAEEQGVPVDTLVDALVARAEEGLDEAVEAGRVSEERAAEIREGLRDRITTMVNEGPRMKLRGPGHRFGPPAGDAPAGEESATTAA